MGHTAKQRQTEPRDRHRWRRVRPLYVLLAVAMGLFAYTFLQRHQEIRRLSSQAAALQLQNQQIERQNRQIQQSIPYLKTPEYVAERARGLLGLTMPGETLIKSRPIQQTIVTERRAPPPLATPPEPTWKQWWNSFFG